MAITSATCSYRQAPIKLFRNLAGNEDSSYVDLFPLRRILTQYTHSWSVSYAVNILRSAYYVCCVA